MLNKSQGAEEWCHIPFAHLLGIFSLYPSAEIAGEVLQKLPVPEQGKARDEVSEKVESSGNHNGEELTPQRSQHGFVELN